MQIFSDLNRVDIKEKTALAIGKFDGIHIGHRKIFDEVFKYRSKGYKTCVFTFGSSLGSFFGNKNVKSITTANEKREILTFMGFDYLFEYPVTKENMAISPEDFIEDILSSGLNAGAVVCGPDCSFGARGEGDFSLLDLKADIYGYDAVMVDKVVSEGEEVSSSLIRKLIEHGDMHRTARLLDRYYRLEGRVEHGRALGRTINMPTVNITPEPDKLLPPFGVYESYVIIGTQRYRGITNIGVKPTVNDENKRKVNVETHILDFNDDLYGENIGVEFINYERPEKKFDDIESLKKQMHSDMLKAVSFFESNSLYLQERLN